MPQFHARDVEDNERDDGEEPSDDGTVINILINQGAYVGVTKYTHSCRLI